MTMPPADTASTETPGLRASQVSLLNRLTNACRDAARTTDQAMKLTIDPSFSQWLLELRNVHEQSVKALESRMKDCQAPIHPRHSLRSRMRRFWMRCSATLTAGSPLALTNSCRREEFRVQSAYELALWVLPSNSVRDVVEDRFQHFLLHRSIIPIRRLPQTQQFLHQAERLQEIYSADQEDESNSDQRRPANASPSAALAGVSMD